MRIPLLAALMLVPASAFALGDAIDTRITFTIADDDVFHGPTESTTASPTIPGFSGSSKNNLFFDNYERRDSGFENLTHLVLYTHRPGFFEGLDTEAGLVLRLEWLTDEGKRNQAGGDSVRLSDDGTYIRLVKQLTASRLSLTAFPISAHRFALGYSYSISWGGRDIFGSGASPGLKLQWDGESGYLFFGAKTGLRQMYEFDGSTEADTVWGVLGGGGLDIADELRLEAAAGFFDRGTIDKPQLQIADIQTGWITSAPWQAFGASAQVTYHVGIPIGIPIDFRLYRNDPLKREEFFKPEMYGEGVSFLVQSEINVLGQTLQDIESPNSSTIQPAIAGDLTGQVKIGYARFYALAVYRDLAYILFNVPSDPPFVDFPNGIKPRPEIFVSVGGDYHFESWHLTPGGAFGIQRTAFSTTRVTAGNNAPSSAGIQTIVYRSWWDREPLNPGERAGLIFAGKGTLRWDFSEAVGAVGELQLSYDPNRRRLAQDPLGIPVRLAADPVILGFAMMLQARL